MESVQQWPAQLWETFIYAQHLIRPFTKDFRGENSNIGFFSRPDLGGTQNKFKVKFTYDGILDFTVQNDRFYNVEPSGKTILSIRSDIIQNKLSDHHMITAQLCR